MEKPQLAFVQSRWQCACGPREKNYVSHMHACGSPRPPNHDLTRASREHRGRHGSARASNINCYFATPFWPMKVQRCILIGQEAAWPNFQLLKAVEGPSICWSSDML
jgi:hypothetical protein